LGLTVLPFALSSLFLIVSDWRFTLGFLFPFSELDGPFRHNQGSHLDGFALSQWNALFPQRIPFEATIGEQYLFQFESDSVIWW
jgi:hypothetical protein